MSQDNTVQELLDKVKVKPNDADLHEKLAAAYIRSGTDFSQALKHAEQAVVLSNGSEKSQLRRTICLWRLHQYGEAKSLVPYIGSSQEALTWKQLISSKPNPVIEVPKIPELKLATTPAKPSANVMKSVSQPQPQIPKLDWFQKDNEVEIVLYQKGLNKDELKTNVVIEPHLIKVESAEFNWSHKIAPDFDVEKSTYRLTAYKVEFTLIKLEPSQWTSLDANDVKAATLPKPAAETTDFGGKKWDSIDVSDEEKDDDPDEFFKKLYKDASPEVRRAMTKSFVESNGTSLSTNWDDVKSRKFETAPPDDMKAENWDK